MLTRKDRLLRTLRGESVDRPAFNFYELNGIDENPSDSDSFNIYSHPSWKRLIDLTAEVTDRIAMRPMRFHRTGESELSSLTTVSTRYDNNGSRFTETRIVCCGRELKSLTRRDPDVRTTWILEHLLKNNEDIETYLSLPPDDDALAPNTESVLEAERKLGDTGLVMIDTGDPLAYAAELFDMATYLTVAMFEPTLFRRLLDRFAGPLYKRVEAFSNALPGRLWRVYGPEYAVPPYLMPDLFKDYVIRYDQPMVDAVHRSGGFIRIHSHGRVHEVLEAVAAMGWDAIDPLEPPPQGNIELRDARRRVGGKMVLFGNLEVSDIETLPSAAFREKINLALEQGTSGTGRGFVLMPSACPYGRELSDAAFENYCAIADIALGGGHYL